MIVRRNLLLMRIITLAAIFLSSCNVLNSTLNKQDSDKSIIASSNLDLRLQWQTNLGEEIWHPILLDQQRIFVRNRTSITALDAMNGKTVWKQSVINSTGFSDPGRLMELTDDTLYLAANQEREIWASVKENGKFRWQVKLKEVVNSDSANPVAKQLLFDGNQLLVLVALSRGTTVIAVNRENGDVIWQAPKEVKGDIPIAMYLLSQSSQVLVDTGEAMYMLDSSTGNISNQPIVRNSFHQVGAFSDSNVVVTYGEVVQGFKMNDLKPLWSFKDNCTDVTDKVIHPPVISDKSAYVFATCGVLYKLNIENGNLIWQTSAEKEILSVALFSDTTYLFLSDGTLLALDPSNGDKIGILSVKPYSKSLSQSYIHESMVDQIVSNERLLILSYENGNIFAFSQK